MKLQAHLPTDSIDTRNWHAAMIGLVSLFGAVVLLLALPLLNNPLLERMRTSPMIRPQISVPHRVPLDLHLWNRPISPWKQFSVAHPLPASDASSQRFSIGIDERVVFEAFGDTALREMLAEKETAPQLKPRNDRLIMMLMLLGLDKRRS
ncbi:hypothetical protein [Candidatus Binatus soli]|jgi:hypothetical protein|uniref:hypothetical protein n=1 Tax=Candidatus Binatus soli TaxID=1953413 RepID=UPI003D0ADC88